MIKEGDRVRLISPMPLHGNGGVRVGDIGDVVEVRKQKSVVINFKACMHWYGLIDEVELVSEDNSGYLHRLETGDPFEPKKRETWSPLRF